MTPHAAYGRSRTQPVSRVDAILALYDHALAGLDRAEKALAAGESTMAAAWLVKAQQIVMTFAEGVRATEDELSVSFFRLYEFVARKLSEPTAQSIKDARKVLVVLQEAFAGVREEAQQLERNGALPPMPESHLLEVTA